MNYPFKFDYTLIDGERYPAAVNAFPDYCPTCNKMTSLSLLFARATGPKTEGHMQAVFLCPTNNCHQMITATYVAARLTDIPHLFTFLRAIPTHVPNTALPDEASEVSPNFVEIYHQSEQAQSLGLKQITGCGYRKALEFLIKDYAIHKNPDDATAIETQFLVPCIRTYIDDTNTKEIAERAAWLGNDETHYSRKWEDHDIEDLKKLIHIVLPWIVNQLRTENYLKNMPKT